MRSDRLPPGRRAALPIARTVLAVLLAGLLCGGSCTVWYSSDNSDPGPCYDDDPDNDFNCPDKELATAGPAVPDPSRLSLADWTLEASTEPGRHPVGRLHSDVGLSVPGLLGPGAWGDDALVGLARDVIRANPEFLALPPAVGRLRAGDVHALDTCLVVEFEQCPPDGGDALPDASLWFVFDGLLHLVEIRNRTLVPPTSPLPPPLRAVISGARRASGSAPTPRR
jgi:hypothetical protein